MRLSDGECSEEKERVRESVCLTPFPLYSDLDGERVSKREGEEERENEATPTDGQRCPLLKRAARASDRETRRERERAKERKDFLLHSLS